MSFLWEFVGIFIWYCYVSKVKCRKIRVILFFLGYLFFYRLCFIGLYNYGEKYGKIYIVFDWYYGWRIVGGCWRGGGVERKREGVYEKRIEKNYKGVWN